MPELTALQKLHARIKCNNRLQTFVNGMNDRFQAANALQTIAMSAHAQYPQFDGHWDHWILVTITKGLTTKAGEAFRQGDKALMDPKSNGTHATLYSVRNGGDTSVPVTNFVYCKAEDYPPVVADLTPA